MDYGLGASRNQRRGESMRDRERGPACYIHTGRQIFDLNEIRDRIANPLKQPLCQETYCRVGNLGQRSRVRQENGKDNGLGLISVNCL
jgi:hypothetical protein